jgi:hypothetical protein
MLMAVYYGKAGNDELFTNKPHHGLLSQYFFFHYHIASVKEFALMPKCTVWQMAFLRSRANSKFFGKSLVMSSSFISSRFGGFSFWIWHNLCVYFNFFNFSHRGSIFSSSFSLLSSEDEYISLPSPSSSSSSSFA